MDENTDMNRVHTIRFGEWIPQSYEPCGEKNWKRRFPKTSEEMTKCFTTEEIYKEFLKS